MPHWKRAVIVALLVVLLPTLASAGTLDMMKINRAAKKGDTERVRELLSEGVPPDTRAPGGETPLFFAAWKGSREVAVLLLEAGANVNHRSDDGRTALIVAATFGRADVVEELLKRGADVNAVTNDGWTTALRRAERGKHSEAVRLLREFGARDSGSHTGPAPQASTARNRPRSAAIPLDAPVPGARLTIRQPCPDPLGAFLYVSVEKPFFIDLHLDSTDSFLDLPGFSSLVKQVVQAIKSSCKDSHMIARMEIAVTSPEHPDPDDPAAVAVYRQGNTVFVETGESEQLTIRNYLFAESKRNDFKAENGVEAEPHSAELVGNPFLFEGKVVAIILRFQTMETAHIGRFATGAGDVLLSGLPEGLFRFTNQPALIAGRVTGKQEIPGTTQRLPSLAFVGAYVCFHPGCSELQMRH